MSETTQGCKNTCVLCGSVFMAATYHPNVCPECKEAILKYKRSNAPPIDDRLNDLRIKKEAAVERAKKNDRIKGEGYAERQIQDSLRLAGKIKTEL